MRRGGFEWNDAKAASNLIKHGVSFTEAATVFDDDRLIVERDIEHSDTEERWRAVGLSRQSRVLAVWYTERSDVTRIIGCREATKAEIRRYGQGLSP